MKKLIYIFVLILPLAVAAQKKEAKVAFSGYKGNYIFNLFKPASAAHPDGEVVGFRLDRKLATEANWQTIQTFASPSNYNELASTIEDGKRKAYEYNAENAYTINDVWPVYQKTFRYDSLSVYLTQQHLAIGFKVLLVDTTANLSNHYQYRVVQLKRDGSEYGKYVSQPVSQNLGALAINKPKAHKREVMGGVFRLSFAAKAGAEVPQALLIRRKAEGDKDFKRIELLYSIEQLRDSIFYSITDDNARADALYQYTVTPVNRFGGGAKVVSDTLSVNSISQKMLIPKAFVAVTDSVKKQINLSWGFIKPELISMVKIYRSESYEEGYSYLTSTNKAFFEDKSIIPGKKYYYYLIISDQLGRSSERSTKVYALIQNAEKPNAPLYVEVMKTERGNKISWQDYNLESRGYKIFRTNQLDGELVPIDTFVYLDRKLEGKYSFIDTTKNSGGLTGYAVVSETMSNVQSGFSKTVYLKEEAKTVNLSAPLLLDFQKDKKSVRIFWQQNARNTNVSGFNVYRKTGEKQYIKINKALVNSDRTTFTDSLTVNGQDLYYKITSVSISGKESEASNEIQADVLTMVYPPSSVKCSFNADKSAVELFWQPSQSEISGYEIYRFTRGSEPVKIGSSKGQANFVDRGFEKDKINYYYVISLAHNGNTSVPSNQTFLSLK
ncbi:hypothetical protein [Pedobacter sp.]|uniref:fibronectin type III domain-containing protein n=1 Tax=Pedobacter sp. TaxID=1411316 RepID=UPI0031D49BDB